MTITATLTDRYVAAAMRTVPESQRADLAAELRASIDDQIDARVDDGEAADAAERAVLTELGDPDEARRRLHRPAALPDRPALLPDVVAAAEAAAGRSCPPAPRSAWRWVRCSPARRSARSIGEVVTVVIAVVVNIGVLDDAGLRRSSSAAAPGRTAGRSSAGGSVDELPEPQRDGAKLSDLIGSLVFLALAAAAVAVGSVRRLRVLRGGGRVAAVPRPRPVAVVDRRRCSRSWCSRRCSRSSSTRRAVDDGGSPRSTPS